MAKVHYIAQEAVLVAIDISKKRNDVLIPRCVEGDSGGGFPKSWKYESMASLIWRAWLWDQRLACGMILTERH